MSFFLRKQAEKSQKVSTKERFYTKKSGYIPYYENVSAKIMSFMIQIIPRKLLPKQGLRRTQEEPHKSWYLSEHHDLVPYLGYR